MKLKKLNYAINPYKAFLEVNYKYSMLLESCIRVKDTGDNSILFFNPKFVVCYKNKRTYVIENDVEREINKTVLDFMDEFLKNTKPLGTGLIFDGGFVGYLSYDFGMEIMKVDKKNQPYYEMPEVFMGYYEDFILVDHKNECTYINTDDKDIFHKIININDKDDEKLIHNNVVLNSNFSKNVFEYRVESVRDYIRIGDVYEVNISQQFRGIGNLSSSDLYNKFRTANYGPYNAYLNFGEFSVLSTSPEQFIRKRGELITTRPIKGTIRKSLNPDENDNLKNELYNSEKNRSELLMIIDLERNDLSRICSPGTVKVESLFEVEEYATVNHLVSTINGKIEPNKTFGEIIRNTFPGGSITGAPKLRSMELIEELENVLRGIYTGSIGYVSNNGNMDFNIVIRTVVINESGVFYNVGGAITWDSEPEDEYEETLHKGRAIYKILTGEDA